ncbi:hypothetical protein ABKN59_003953 [Abortiporus biennis]
MSKYIKKNKFGCTCGECAFGWLSPRMRMQMMFCSSSLHRELVNFKPNVPDNQLYSRTEIETLDISLFYSIPYKNKEHVTNDLVNAVLQVLHQTSNRTSTSRLPTP